ncbi:hypothetical protein PanWU01x14_100540 [Parasponia andersonii]|uniref:Uncharacterized protein n=1 Tax=Parasponia andersonii TaxID=3476 RepID=A0A2P5D3L4_PARAD|nr:hypothetical protein PanWU01x14_100540 [Parasponia andersonii]
MSRVVGILSSVAFVGRRQNKGVFPLQVVCVDYPRPELENTVNFLDVAALSSCSVTLLVQLSLRKS